MSPQIEEAVSAAIVLIAIGIFVWLTAESPPRISFFIPPCRESAARPGGE